MKKNILFALIALIASFTAAAIEPAELNGVWQSEMITEEIPDINATAGQAMVCAFIDSSMECAVCHTISFKLSYGIGASVEAMAFVNGKGTFTLNGDKITVKINEDGYAVTIPEENIIVEGIDGTPLADQLTQGCVQMLQMVTDMMSKQYRTMKFTKVAFEDEHLTFKFDDDKYVLTRAK